MAPAVPIPAKPAVHVPPPPAIPTPAAPALAAPKSKMDGLVPILLVVNTFLLVLILITLLFVIKAR